MQAVVLMLITGLRETFPDGVYDAHFGPATEDLVATQQLLLLNRMKGSNAAELKNVSGTAQQDWIHVQLGNWLRNRRCLLLLDDVRSPEVVSKFTFDAFMGAVLVTGLCKEVWPSAPSTVAITLKHTTDPLDGGPSLAERLLASMWSSNLQEQQLPAEYQV